MQGGQIPETCCLTQSTSLTQNCFIKAPGAHTLAHEFHTAPSTATYIGSAPSVLYAFAPFIWIPLSLRVGRRPILLVTHVIALLAAIGVGRSSSYAQALGFRMVMGFGGSAGLCISPGAISDMFFLHEKGTRLGINSILFVVAPYIGKTLIWKRVTCVPTASDIVLKNLGGVAGGSVQLNPKLGWRWAMYISAACYAFQLLGQILFGQ